MKFNKCTERNCELDYRLEGLQGKFIGMKSERDKLIEISNELRADLNKLKKKQSPKKEETYKTFKSKLEKLKTSYNNLNEFNENNE